VLQEIGLWAGFILTLMVFSYVLGDNVLYRLAVYVFVGLSAGYVAVVTYNSVLYPWLQSTVLSGELLQIILGFVPLFLGALLILKGAGPFGWLSGLSMALLIGVGAAVALVGAVRGTLIPLALAPARPELSLPNFLFGVIGVVCSLFYFMYIANPTPSGKPRRSLPVAGMALIGEAVLTITLGTLYASAVLTSLTVLTERVGFIVSRLGAGG
jgi:hypothetical protein